MREIQAFDLLSIHLEYIIDVWMCVVVLVNNSYNASEMSFAI